MSKTKHIPVLLNETIDSMDIKQDQIVLDATLGGGGHAKIILDKMCKTGTFVAFDVSDTATSRFTDFISTLPSPKLKIILINDNFRNIKQNLTNNDIQKVDRIYADLGFSTDQLENDLSFKAKGELDLRMDKNLSVKAKDLVNGLYKKELIKLFEENSDEILSKAIAEEIVRVRNKKPIENKEELLEIIETVVANSKNIRNKRFLKPEARIFQALRMVVNDEVNSLKEFLHDGFDILNKNGRMGIISFHSGEDRIVKQFMSNEIKKNNAKWVEKLIVPSEKEIRDNSKSSSAKLRVIEKTVG